MKRESSSIQELKLNKKLLLKSFILSSFLVLLLYTIFLPFGSLFFNPTYTVLGVFCALGNVFFWGYISEQLLLQRGWSFSVAIALFIKLNFALGLILFLSQSLKPDIITTLSSFGAVYALAVLFLAIGHRKLQANNQ